MFVEQLPETLLVDNEGHDGEEGCKAAQTAPH
jgi:hypothetical protein